MKNFTPFLLISLVLYSCSKETEIPYTNPPSPPAPPPTNAAPVAGAMITIDGESMNITSLSYHRRPSGAGGGVFITASNNIQKVTAVASPFYQYSQGSYTCMVEVSYFTRADSLSGWGVAYPRAMPRDDKIIFNNCLPLTQKVVSGNFSGSFIGPSGSLKEGDRIIVTGYFFLVF